MDSAIEVFPVPPCPTIAIFRMDFESYFAIEAPFPPALILIVSAGFSPTDVLKSRQFWKKGHKALDTVSACPYKQNFTEIKRVS
jgi:hypothetical protein